MNGQISKTIGDAVNGEHPVSSGVPHLFRLARPLAIIWRISKCVVFAIQSQPFRAFTHVFKKCLERVHPSFANANATVGVVVVEFKRWATSFFHVHPSSIRATPRLANAVTMGGSQFQRQAPARLRFSVSKVISLGGYFLSAFTNTFEPCSCAFAVWSFGRRFLGNHGESPESLSDYGFSISHG